MTMLRRMPVRAFEDEAHLSTTLPVSSISRGACRCTCRTYSWVQPMTSWSKEK